MRGGNREGDHGQGDDDPFAHLDLDESFINAAPVREASAAERSRRAPADLAAHRRASARQRKLEARAARRARRRARTRYWRSWTVIVLGGAMLAAWIWTTAVSPSPDGSWATSTDTFVHESTITRFPPPPDDAGDIPLGAPLTPAVTSPDFAYTMVQSDGATPVAYDPCRPIRVVINARTAPPEGAEMVDAAIAEMSRVTGLRFIVEGASDEAPTHPREPLQQERYGNRWAPVLVAWSDPAETDQLDGAVAGVGGSQAISKGSDELVYVTGTVVLDGPQFEEMLGHPEGRAAAEAVVLHELGHLVGLDHIAAHGELMQPEGHPEVTGFGPGDLTGLAELGRGICRPDL